MEIAESKYPDVKTFCVNQTGKGKFDLPLLFFLPEAKLSKFQMENINR